MKTPRPSHVKRHNQAIALVIVLSMLAVLVILIVAMLSLSQRELSSSHLQVKQETGREYAEVAVNLVTGQIREGTARRAGDVPTFWASQPGAIRKYLMGGNFSKGFKLYSSRSMEVVGDEQLMLADATPRDWHVYPARFVDLNEPIVRPGVAGVAATVSFPIIDPRAYVPANEAGVTFSATTGEPPLGTANKNVEGFYYNSAGVFGVNAATSHLDIAARLPMPVEWLYVQKNGAFCTIDDDGITLVTAAGAPLTDDDARTNPIVARIAFWTDDESSKLNINTASEPTFWATPHLIHSRDLNWAHQQPSAFEYQRYPGHPATTALSSVLFPNVSMDLYSASAGGNTILSRKESIYRLIPKINRGGSVSGTIPIWKYLDTRTGYRDDNLLGKMVDLQNSVKERLFSSVDEMLFGEFSEGKNRALAKLVDPASGDDTQENFFDVAGDPSILDRSRFFLTPHSRAPETNIWGMPKVSMWPVGTENKPGENTSNPQTFRTGFDNMIAYASTLRKNITGDAHSYYFRRSNSNRWFNGAALPQDVQIPRNVSLLNYLDSLMALGYPNGGRSSGGTSFTSKMGEDADQLLLEIFDYVRMTNTYDGFLAPNVADLENNSTGNIYRIDGSVYNDKNSNGSRTDEIYEVSQQNRTLSLHKTFTPYAASRNLLTQVATETAGVPGDAVNEIEVDQSFPGHGQVVPSERNGKIGIGRFLTLSEAGFHFICSGDGNNDKGSQPLLQKEGDQYIPVPNDKKSGGRTAIKIKEHTGDGRGSANEQEYTDTFTKQKRYEVWYSNFPPYPSAVTQKNVYGLDPSLPLTDPRNPRCIDPRTNRPYHPGMDPANWNATLDYNARTGGVPLQIGEKRVQGMFVMEFTLLSPGFTAINPDFSVVVRGLGATKLDGKSLYSTTGQNIIVWKSGQRTMDQDGSRGSGGSITTFAMYNGRRTKSPIPGIFNDPGYETSASGGKGGVHDGLLNFDLTTTFVTTVGQTMQFTGGDVTIELYTSHAISSQTLVQTYQIRFPNRQLPVPELVTVSSDHRQWTDGNNNINWQYAVHAPRWWAFNHFGCLERFSIANGGVTQLTAPPENSPIGRQVGGRFYSLGSTNDRLSLDGVPHGRASVWSYDSSNPNYLSGLLKQTNPSPDSKSDAYTDTQLVDMSAGAGTTPTSRGTDVIFTMVPAHGDLRLLAAKKTVPFSDWVQHPNLQKLGTADSLNNGDKRMVAHNLARYNTSAEAGYMRDASPYQFRLANGANYTPEKIPDLVPTITGTQFAKRYGDFDTAASDMRDGPWINKPDEGSASLVFRSQGNKIKRWVNSYLGGRDEWVSASPGQAMMSPNRMVCSPVSFGSLPTGVQRSLPWQTLLFRAYTPPQNGMANHPGEAGYFGGTDPADHYLLDLFTMPVVEPYAITENFSTAGKINMNYQILPFGLSKASAVGAAGGDRQTYIRRSTGMHALMKGEMMAVVPIGAANKYKAYPKEEYRTRDTYLYRQPFSDIQADSTNGGLQQWYRRIEVERKLADGLVAGTLRQFEDRFNFNTTTWSPVGSLGLFRTPSQICEVHLIPRKLTASSTNGGDENVGTPMTPDQMADYWSKGTGAKALTSDNLKERVYSNLYARLTTQSNTYKVYYRVQTIQKARSSVPNQFEIDKDRVTSDFRGSAIIERSLDVYNTAIPDYGSGAVNAASLSLENFYRYRVREMKRFIP